MSWVYVRYYPPGKRIKTEHWNVIEEERKKPKGKFRSFFVTHIGYLAQLYSIVKQVL
tara:strand:- start:101 stop:271 length:171 start_codon:yes stop_codon:yes gene_type:complete